MGLGYTWYEWFCIFVIYGMFGWCLEVGYAALESGKFVNRGFLNGPICPIYGFGGSIVIGCLYQFREQFVLVFFGAIFLSTVLEYITGYILEKIFHEQWWDYSNMPFNIKGYVCLKFSILWGVACVLVVDVIHPPVEKFVRFVPERVEIVAVIVILIAFLADCIVTVASIVRWKRKIVLMTEIVEVLRSFSDGVGDSISVAVLKAISVGSEWKDVFVKDERYLEMKEELEEKKQLLEDLGNKYRSILKLNKLSSRRLEKAFPKLAFGNPIQIKNRWKEVKRNGLWYGKKKR